MRINAARFWAGVLLGACLAGSTGWVSAATTATPPPKPPFPTISLPDRVQGTRAVELLGARLPEVAAWYGLSPQVFSRMLRTDPTVWLDRRGRVFFQEDTRLPKAPGRSRAETGAATTATPAPLAQTFLLHSRPQAKRTIYLNFVGATLTGTAWNIDTGQPSITAVPFDLDGVPYSFSTEELERIQYIWQRVAEHYSPFDVDVTTEPPPADRITRSGPADDVFGTVALVTKDTFVNCGCGGIAYLGIFDDVGDFYKPALVFYDALGAGSEKPVADTISHEVGHNVGLRHDGTSTNAYYLGHGSGATGWAPIMGVSFYQLLAQWSNGEYADANNQEDDYVVMQANGLPGRLDDHGDAVPTATPLSASTAGGVTTLAGSGVIGQPADIDVFSFAAGAGSVTINVTPAPRGPALDILAVLRDSAGTLLATSNPVDSLPARLTTTLAAAGRYYVTVDGTGKGDPLATGYTDYGSIGQYTINGMAQASPSQPPLAVIGASPLSGVAALTVDFDGSASSDPDGSIVSYAWNFGDGGTQAGGTSAQHTYVTPGTYNASLTVTDNSGIADTALVTITVQPPASTYTLSVSKAGSGTGSVTSTPAGIDCGSDCVENYASGTSVTLTASAAGGSSFSGWSGACTGTEMCVVNMTANRSVTASFASTTSHTLVVSKVGTGTVSSTPPGINCGGDCSESYTQGTAVSLTATPGPRSILVGWSGDCAGSASCNLSMTAARSVTATFWTDGYEDGPGDNSAAATTNTLEADQTHDLAAIGGIADQDWFRIVAGQRRSYEVLVVADSGTLDFSSPASLERYDATGSTLRQTGGASRSQALMRWINDTDTNVEERVRVTTGQTSLTPDARYRIQFRDTTLYCPRFNNAGTQASVLILQHAAADVATCTVSSYFYEEGTVTLVGTDTRTLSRDRMLVIGTASIPGLAGAKGHARVAHTCGSGGVKGKLVALEPATGFSFDTLCTSDER